MHTLESSKVSGPHMRILDGLECDEIFGADEILRYEVTHMILHTSPFTYIEGRRNFGSREHGNDKRKHDAYRTCAGER